MPQQILWGWQCQFGVLPRNNVGRIGLVLQMLKETLKMNLELLGSGWAVSEKV